MSKQRLTVPSSLSSCSYCSFYQCRAQSFESPPLHKWVCLTHDLDHSASLWERRLQQQKYADRGVALGEIAEASNGVRLVGELLKLWVTASAGTRRPRHLNQGSVDGFKRDCSTTHARRRCVAGRASCGLSRHNCRYLPDQFFRPCRGRKSSHLGTSGVNQVFCSSTGGWASDIRGSLPTDVTIASRDFSHC